MKFTFRIEEKTTYWQEGTVDVEAENEEEARKLCIAGEYEHHGDNYILVDSEGLCIERVITEDV